MDTMCQLNQMVLQSVYFVHHHVNDVAQQLQLANHVYLHLI